MLDRIRVKRYLIDENGWSEEDWGKFLKWLAKVDRHPRTQDEWTIAAMEWVNK